MESERLAPKPFGEKDGRLGKLLRRKPRIFTPGSTLPYILLRIARCKFDLWMSESRDSLAGGPALVVTPPTPSRLEEVIYPGETVPETLEPVPRSPSVRTLQSPDSEAAVLKHRSASPVITFEYERFRASPGRYPRPASPLSSHDGITLAVAGSLVGPTPRATQQTRPEYGSFVMSNPRSLTNVERPDSRLSDSSMNYSPINRAPSPYMYQTSGFSSLPRPMDKSLPPTPSYAEVKRAGSLREFWRTITGKKTAHEVHRTMMKTGNIAPSGNLNRSQSLLSMSSYDSLARYNGGSTNGQLFPSTASVRQITESYVGQLNARLARLRNEPNSEEEIRRCREALASARSLLAIWSA